MDGKHRWMENVFVHRFWPSVGYGTDPVAQTV